MNTENCSVVEFPSADVIDSWTTYEVDSCEGPLTLLCRCELTRDVVSTDSGRGDLLIEMITIPAQTVRFRVGMGAAIPTLISGTQEKRHGGRYFSVDIEAELQFAIPSDDGAMVVQYAVTQA